MLPFVAPWINTEGIILSEIKQKDILYGITYMWNLKKKADFIETENRMPGYRGWGKTEM